MRSLAKLGASNSTQKFKAKLALTRRGASRRAGGASLDTTKPNSRSSSKGSAFRYGGTTIPRRLRNNNEPQTEPRAKVRNAFYEEDEDLEELHSNTLQSDAETILRHQDHFKAPLGTEIDAEYRTKVVELVITVDEAGRRIDNFLISILPSIPKSNFYKLMRKGEIRINKGRIKPDQKLEEGDVIRICPLTMRNTQKPTDLSLHDVAKLDKIQELKKRIVYEDQHMLILNKPVGIAVHGGSGLSYGVIEALRVLYPKERTLELVHRIDRETSGLLIIAKKMSVLRQLQEQFREKTISKSYYCLVNAVGRNCVVDKPLLRYEVDGERFVKVSPQGKPSQTKFVAKQIYEDYEGNKFTLLEASPLTGRTHQIRVHAKEVFSALAGDPKYLDPIDFEFYRYHGLRRMFLQAFKLNFVHPVSGERITIEEALDAELRTYLSKLRPIS